MIHDAKRTEMAKVVDIFSLLTRTDFVQGPVALAKLLNYNIKKVTLLSDS